MHRSKQPSHTHRSIPAMGASIFTLALQDLRVGGLEVLATRWLDVDQTVDGLRATVGTAIGTESVGWRGRLAGLGGAAHGC